MNENIVLESDILIISLFHKLKRKIWHLLNQYQIIDSTSLLDFNMSSQYFFNDNYKKLYIYYDQEIVNRYMEFLSLAGIILSIQPSEIDNQIFKLSCIIKEWDRHKIITQEHINDLNENLKIAEELSNNSLACTNTYRYIKYKKNEEIVYSKSLTMALKSDRISYQDIYIRVLNLKKSEIISETKIIRYIKEYTKMIPTLAASSELLLHIYSYCGNTPQFFRYKTFAKKLIDILSQYTDILENVLDALNIIITSLHEPIPLLLKTYY